MSNTQQHFDGQQAQDRRLSVNAQQPVEAEQALHRQQVALDAQTVQAQDSGPNAIDIEDLPTLHDCPDLESSLLASIEIFEDLQQGATLRTRNKPETQE